MLRVNDLIITNVNTGGAPVTKFYVVTSNAGGVVGVTVYA